MNIQPLYTTRLGVLYCADSLDVMKQLDAASIDLVVTSPPYALHFKKEYGNAEQNRYVKWFLPFANEIRRVLKPEGSFILNIGGAWTPGAPTRSLYHFRLLIALCDKIGFHLAQEFFWYNPAKMPAPAEWVTVRRIRVKDSVEYIFWLSPSTSPKANNMKVLQGYSKDMERLIKKGIAKTRRPSGHNITEKFCKDRGGSIPANFIQSEPDNVISCGNNESNSEYIKSAKRQGRRIHPARFPSAIPKFFIEFLTDSEDTVLDPFAGSNTTGAIAEGLGRKWIAIEKDRGYAEDSLLRFKASLSASSSDVREEVQLALSV